jgi:hypothetical protein
MGRFIKVKKQKRYKTFRGGVWAIQKGYSAPRFFSPGSHLTAKGRRLMDKTRIKGKIYYG